MRLQIKTLNQKSILVDIDDTKTVYELKKELSSYPDVGVIPELQKLIYAGKILSNADELSVYNIDTKKFLVVMILKQPLEEAAAASNSAGAEKKTSTTTTAAGSTSTMETVAGSATTTTATAAAAAANVQKPATPTAAETAAAAAQATTQLAARASEEAAAVAAAAAASARVDTRDELVQQIVGMGYPEVEVRHALAASFNNPERAIEYLIEGIPTDPSTPEGGGYDYADADESAELSPFEVFRSDPLFRNLRRAIQQHPDLINDAIQRVGEANPALLSLINENQMEFFSMLVEASDDDDDESS